MLWRLIPFAILWSMWQERNARIFKQTKEDVDQLVLVSIAKWASTRDELDCY